MIYKNIDITGNLGLIRTRHSKSQNEFTLTPLIGWDSHDPTTLNRQGPDVGTQYRSAIFYHDDQQKAAAIASRDALQASGKYSRPIVTQIVPAEAFYPAEDYHQQYLEKRGLASCHI